MDRVHIFRFIVNALKPFKWWVVLQILTTAIWAADLSLRPFLIKKILDSLVISKEAVWSATALYVFMSSLLVLIFRLYDVASIKVQAPLKRYIGDYLMSKIMGHSHAFLQNHFVGNVATRIKDVMSSVPDMIDLIIDTFFPQALSLLIAIGTMWCVDRKFGIGLLIWVLIFVYYSIVSSKRARVLIKKAAEVNSSVVGYMVDILTNMQSVRLFSNKLFEKKMFYEHLNKYVEADQKRDGYFSYITSKQGILFVIYQTICIYWLIDGFYLNKITTGDFVLVLTINISIVRYLRSLSSDISKYSDLFSKIGLGLRIALAQHDVVDDQNAIKLITSSEAHSSKLGSEIIFQDVDFHYRGITPLFQKISVVIPAAQKVGLVGYSGSGKSTFVNLILRLFDVTSGKILIDNQDVKYVTQESLRASIAMIPQDPTLFHRSIMENIRYANIEATDDAVVYAAACAHAHEFIRKLPDGYNSTVGERGLKLSGGQRQRIAIARAVLRNAPILILDEATSQLDSITESAIQDSLNELMQHKTTIVIAHRLSTLLRMDRILVFEKGKIVQDGTHTELLQQEGLYQLLWNTQIGGFLPEKK